METRIGVVGIVVKNRREMASTVNEILSAHADIVVGRMGVPYREKNVSVVTLIRFV